MCLSCWEMPRDFTNKTLHVAKYYLSPLITAEIPHEKPLRMSDYQALLHPRICSFVFFFYNNAPQSKALTVNNKRKIFPFWKVQTDADACQCWHVPLSQLMHFTSHCSLCSGLHCSLWLVLSFALRGFSPGTLVFPYPTRLGVTDKESLCGCSTSKSSLINKGIYNFFRIIF